MSKRRREPIPDRGAASDAAAAGPEGWVRFAVVGGIGLVVVLSAWGVLETREVRKELNQRLGAVDDRINQLAAKVEAPRPAAAPQRGPDPNKVYPVKTEGAPFKGSPNAPITIAEFSDFQ